jgi:hypothetical protein
MTHDASRPYFNTGGTPLVAASVVPSAGFGSTASVIVTAGSTDSRGRFSITCSGTGQGANPTCVLTFADGAWDAVPFAHFSRADAVATAGLVRVTTRTATALTFTFIGTPVANDVYIFDYFVVG